MSTAAAVDPTPSPAPASEVRARIEPPARPGDSPAQREARRKIWAQMEADRPAMEEATKLYGDDIDREMDALKAGTHPLQRGGVDLDAWAKLEARIPLQRAG